MAHRGFFGMTESGKTTLAVVCAKRFADNGIPRLILDPLNDPRWQAVPETDWQGDDPDEFTRLWKSNKQCALFIDESGESLGRYAGQMNQVVTKGRHWGHETHIIGQEPQQIDPIVRGQLGEVYLFRSSPTVAKMFADEFADKSILRITELQQFEFFMCRRFKPVQKCRIDVVTGVVSYVNS